MLQNYYKTMKKCFLSIFNCTHSCAIRQQIVISIDMNCFDEAKKTTRKKIVINSELCTRRAPGVVLDFELCFVSTLVSDQWRFPSDSEAFASELLGNLKDMFHGYYMHSSDAFRMFKSLTIQWCVKMHFVNMFTYCGGPLY